MLAVVHAVLCTSAFLKRVDLMLSVLTTTTTNKTKGQENLQVMDVSITLTVVKVSGVCAYV